MIRRFLWLCIAIGGLAQVASADAAGRLAEYRSIQLSPPAARGDTRLSFEAFGTNWRLNLRDHAGLVAELPPESRRRILAGGNRFMTGEVAGRPGSWARLNWIAGRWWGAFHDGRQLYLIDRAGAFVWEGDTRPPAGEDLVFRVEDVDLPDIVLAHPLRPTPAFDGALSPVPRGESGFMSMPVTIVADTAFQDEHGPDAAPIVTGRFNFVDGIYSNQLGTGLVLEHLELLEDDGPLTPIDASDLLNAFRQFMAGGDGSDIPFAGLAHLFTSRERDGGIAGIAFLSALCSSSFGYGVDWDTSGETVTSLVFAHELGHNFGAPHDGEDACADETFDGIMNPVINGSEQFSQCSLAEMQARVDNATCLVDTPGAGLIFGDAFQSAAR